MISIIFLNEYIDDVVEEVNAKEALKSSIFVVQKAAAPKTGVESRQSSIGTIRSSLATSYDVWRRRATLGVDCSCCSSWGKRSQLLLRPTKVGLGLKVQSGP